MKKKVRLFSYALIICSFSMLNSCIGPPKVSDWYKVTVVSRTELMVPYNAFTSETKVILKFSDGTSWEGYDSTTGGCETFLLSLQQGETAYYRYNSHYFSGKQWTARKVRLNNQ